MVSSPWVKRPKPTFHIELASPGRTLLYEGLALLCEPNNSAIIQVDSGKLMIYGSTGATLQLKNVVDVCPVWNVFDSEDPVLIEFEGLKSFQKELSLAKESFSFIVELTSHNFGETKQLSLKLTHISSQGTYINVSF